MGLIPNTECKECGGYYYSCGRYGPVTHCEYYKKRMDELCESLKRAHGELKAIITAYRERGECVAEINEAAYSSGRSLSRNEFVWLDEEIERISKLREEKKAQEGMMKKRKRKKRCAVCGSKLVKGWCPNYCWGQ